MIKLNMPVTEAKMRELKAGDTVLLSGTMYIGRDAAHLKMVNALKNGEELPFDPEGAVIYYAGPAPARPGQVMNSVGPTSSYRMDPYSEDLMKVGVKGMIGKGSRSSDITPMLSKYGAVYFVVVGGAAALTAVTMKSQEIIAYPELGAEALRKVEVVDFAAIVGTDTHGTNIVK